MRHSCRTPIAAPNTIMSRGGDFLAGGGPGGITSSKSGTTLGSRSVIENPLTIHDIHTTALHQLGLDHEQLTFWFGGRNVSLTDMHGCVVSELVG